MAGKTSLLVSGSWLMNNNAVLGGAIGTLTSCPYMVGGAVRARFQCLRVMWFGEFTERRRLEEASPLTVGLRQNFAHC